MYPSNYLVDLRPIVGGHVIGARRLLAEEVLEPEALGFGRPSDYYAVKEHDDTATGGHSSDSIIDNISNPELAGHASLLEIESFIGETSNNMGQSFSTFLSTYIMVRP